ncbi:MAG TPA: CoA pyrophosphatase [Vicinamibacteria bacterium]|nr:CoA pyrophosphatase [Vicinamibacteria bacterium]
MALVLREATAAGLELLFILRAEHERDPWSGHVGFPGGRAEPEDESLQATAVRETLEETGLDLRREAEPLGGLDEVRALARGRPVDLVIAPFVFHLLRPAEGRPSHEVVSLHWLPLQALLDPAWRSTLDYRHREATVELPCIRLGGLVIWGLTYRMFESFEHVLREAEATT